jgi:hypothetical protein
LPVLICAERDAEDSDMLLSSTKDAVYCHRFTLARLVLTKLRKYRPERAFAVVRLRLGSLIPTVEPFLNG